MKTSLPLRIPSRLVLVAVLLAIGVNASTLRAADPVRMMPPSVVAYAELSQPDALLDVLLAPSTSQLLAGIEPYQKYLKSKEYGHVQFVVGLLETRLGVNWQAALRDIVGGGVHFAVDPADQSALLVIRSRKPELLTKLNEAMVELIEADAKNNSRPSPIKSKEYNGVVGWQFGPESVHAIIDDMLVVSNKPDALKGAIDRSRDAAAKSLADAPEFQQASGKKPPGGIGWAWTSLDAVRKAPNVEKALNGRSNNPLIELLFGGVLDALRRAPFATAGLTLDGNRLRLVAELPRDASQTSAARSWYFAPDAKQGAPAALRPAGTIATLSFFRDLAGLWLAREELFDEKVVAGFAQADTQLGLFFSGRDFGPEVLGELEPGWQFVVARQDYAAEAPVPGVKLPAMALVLQMKHPDEFATQMLVAYQKVVGLTNIVGGQQGQPQLLLSTEDYRGSTISKAVYVVEKQTSKDKAKLNYNFSPACARAGDRFIYGSTVGIVRQLIDSLAAGGTTTATADNVSLSFTGGPLAAILEDNRELLVSQNMLSEGRTRAEAEAAIDALFKLVKLTEQAGLRLTAEPGSLALEAAIEIKPSP
ncbi:MAG TPA: DUF3352 domain-containing protein [Pirellulales bacterium]|nr:DUF3352 domain-containing protein [Pirellulales bacterium]